LLGRQLQTLGNIDCQGREINQGREDDDENYSYSVEGASYYVGVGDWIGKFSNNTACVGGYGHEWH